MKSKAHFAGRPIHPMLVGVPIALFVATIVLELAHIGTHDAFYYRAAMVANIAGVMLALLAIVPGALDRATGIRHSLLSLPTIVVFAISGALLVRGWTGRELVDGSDALDAHLPVAFGMIGIVALTYAAALGYALDRIHHLGIRPTILRAAQPVREHAARDFDSVLHN